MLSFSGLALLAVVATGIGVPLLYATYLHAQDLIMAFPYVMMFTGMTCTLLLLTARV